LAIPKGQMESTVAIGMSYRQSMQHIILPQVFRIIIPAITNEAVTTLKNTSLLSTITIVELTLKAEMIISYTFRPFDFYIIAAIGKPAPVARELLRSPGTAAALEPHLAGESSAETEGTIAPLTMEASRGRRDGLGMRLMGAVAKRPGHTHKPDITKCETSLIG